MNKKAKIILGLLLGGALATGAGVTAAFLASKPKNKQMAKYPDLGITKSDEEKAKKLDVTKDKDNKALKDYIDSVINALNNGAENAPKAKSEQEYKIANDYLEKSLEFGESGKEILKQFLDKLPSDSPKAKENKQLKEKLEKALEDAKKANKELKDKLLVKEEIKSIKLKTNEEIKNIEDLIILAEIKQKLQDLNKILSELNAAKQKVETLKLDEEKQTISKIKETLDKSIAELKVKEQALENDPETQKKAIKDYLNTYKKDVKDAVEKSQATTTIDSMEKSVEKLDKLVKLGQKIVIDANKLGLTAEKTEYETEKEKANTELMALKARLEAKKLAIQQAKEAAAQALQKAKDAIKAARDSRDEASLEKAITDLNAAISEMNDAKTKTEDQNLDKETNELKNASLEANLALNVAKENKEKRAKTKGFINDLDVKITNLTNALATNNKQNIQSAKEELKLAYDKAKEFYDTNKNNEVISNDLGQLNQKLILSNTLDEEAIGKIELLKQKEQQIKDDINKAKNDLATAQAEATQALKGNDINALKGAKEKLAKAIAFAEETETKARNNNFVTEADELKELIKSAKNKKIEITDKISGIELDTLQAKKDKFNELTTKLQLAIQKAEEALKDENKNNLELSKEALEEIIKVLNESNDLKEIFKNQHNDFNMEYDALLAKIDIANPLKNQLLILKLKIEEELKTLEQKLKIEEKNIEDNKKLFEPNKNNLEKLKEIKQKISQVQARLVPLGSKVNNEFSNPQYNNVKNLYEKIKNEANLFNIKVKEKIEELEKEINKSKSKIQTALNELQEGLVKTENDKGTLRLDGSTGSIQFLEDKIALALKTMEEEQKNKDELEIKLLLDNLKLKMEEAKKKVKEYKESLTEIKAKLDAEFAAIKQRDNDIKGIYEEPIGEISTASNTYIGLQGKYEVIISDWEILKEKYGSSEYNKTEIENYDKKLKSFYENIKNRKQEISDIMELKVSINNKESKLASEINVSNITIENPVNGFNFTFEEKDLKPNDESGNLELTINITGKFEAIHKINNISGFKNITIPKSARIKKDKYFDFVLFLFNKSKEDTSGANVEEKLLKALNDNFLHIKKNFMEYKINLKDYVGWDSYIFTNKTKHPYINVSFSEGINKISTSEKSIEMAIITGKKPDGSFVYKTIDDVSLQYEDIVITFFQTMGRYFNSLNIMKNIYKFANIELAKYSNKVSEIEEDIQNTVNKLFENNFSHDADVENLWSKWKNNIKIDYNQISQEEKIKVGKHFTESDFLIDYAIIGIEFYLDETNKKQI